MAAPRGNKIKNLKYIESNVPQQHLLTVFERDGHVIIGHPDMIHHCIECDEWKNQVEFAPQSKIDKFGRKILRNICRKCSNENVKIHLKLYKIHSDRPSNCQICDKPPKYGKRIQMDIDHKTKEFRGWLCSEHNTAFGKFQDNPFEMIKGIKYLIAGHHDKQKLTEELQTLIKDINDKME